MKQIVVALILLLCAAGIGSTLLAKPMPEAKANMLLSPCPLGVKNLPIRKDETV